MATCNGNSIQNDTDTFKWDWSPLPAHDNVFVVAIEGAIGTGKSTFITRTQQTQLFKRELDNMLGHNKVHVVCRLEPVETWRENGMLQDFYDHKLENAYAFQVQVFEDHVAVVRQAIAPYLKGSGDSREGQPVVLIMERSMFSQLLFWRQQEHDGFTTLTQRIRYMKQWQTWRNYIPSPHLYVFMRIPHEDDTGHDDQVRLDREMERIQRRVQSRGRTEEGADEPLDTDFMAYNRQILERHETFWPQGTCNPEGFLKTPAACVHCDVSRRYDVDDTVLRQVSREIAGYIATYVAMKGYGYGYDKPDMHKVPVFDTSCTGTAGRRHQASGPTKKPVPGF